MEAVGVSSAAIQKIRGSGLEVLELDRFRPLVGCRVVGLRLAVRHVDLQVVIRQTFLFLGLARPCAGARGTGGERRRGPSLIDQGVKRNGLDPFCVRERAAD